MKLLVRVDHVHGGGLGEVTILLDAAKNNVCCGYDPNIRLKDREQPPAPGEDVWFQSPKGGSSHGIVLLVLTEDQEERLAQTISEVEHRFVRT